MSIAFGQALILFICHTCFANASSSSGHNAPSSGHHQTIIRLSLCCLSLLNGRGYEAVAVWGPVMVAGIGARRRTLVRLVGCASWYVIAAAAMAAKPDLTLARKFNEEFDPSHYYVSEKLDGVRAYWDGHELLSRQGNKFAAPLWFTAKFPSMALDGELWIKRNSFAELSGIVRRKDPHEGWRQVRYMVFDAPQVIGNFKSRLERLQQTILASGSPYLRAIEQWQASSIATLYRQLDDIVSLGGEGLMLRHRYAPYRGGRSKDLLKLKPFSDAEAVVLAYYPGQGKFAGMMGSLQVEGANGVEFNIGSGFTQAERMVPPPIGTSITFRYTGLTKSGKPRFPVFLRRRRDEPGTAKGKADAD